MVYKGSRSNIDSYSSFYDNQRLNETKLRNELEKRGVTDLYICGIATDVCVCKYFFLNMHVLPLLEL
jgi:nicotinamidase-related amidase